MPNENNNNSASKAGRKNQSKITTAPAMRIKIWKQMPTIIKTILQRAPMKRENVFETRVLKNPPMSKPLGYAQLYLCHGEKRVFRSRGMEKKLEPKEIKFCQTCSKNFGFS